MFVAEDADVNMRSDGSLPTAKDAVTSLWTIAASPTCTAGLGAFPIPAVGEAIPGRLYDGHPVFVTHDLDGTITVVESVSTHLPDDPLGWCEKDRTIDDIAHSARWDAQGRYVGGPAATDLGTYQHMIDDQSGQIIVLLYEPPQTRTKSPIDIAADSCIATRDYITHSPRQGT